MPLKKKIEVFDNDVLEKGGYVYTTSEQLSSRMATQRTTDIILDTGCFIGKSVLDMGCGDGFFTIKIFDHGKPNIMVADMWREDITPFNTVIATMKFVETCCPTAKIHIIAVPVPGASNPVIDPMFGNLRKSGYIGKITTVVSNLEEIMRASDILVSPVGIETRTILEASAIGLPIVAGTGCQLASSTSDPRSIDGTVNAIKKCWEKFKLIDKKVITGKMRKRIEKNYGLKKTGLAVKKIYEGVYHGVV